MKVRNIRKSIGYRKSYSYAERMCKICRMYRKERQ